MQLAGGSESREEIESLLSFGGVAAQKGTRLKYLFGRRKLKRRPRCLRGVWRPIATTFSIENYVSVLK